MGPEDGSNKHTQQAPLIREVLVSGTSTLVT